MISLTQEEKNHLENNCKAIRDYLISLVKDYEYDVTIKVDFYGYCWSSDKSPTHPMGISVEKRGSNINVYGYTGGLGIVFAGERDYNHTIAWDYPQYSVQLCEKWQELKPQFISKLEGEKKTRYAIKNFVV